MSRWTRSIATLLLAGLPVAVGAQTSPYAGWIAEMKASPSAGPSAGSGGIARTARSSPPLPARACRTAGAINTGSRAGAPRPCARKGSSSRNLLAGIDAARRRATPTIPRELRAVPGREVPGRVPTTAGSCAGPGSTAAPSRRRTSATGARQPPLAMAAGPTGPGTGSSPCERGRLLPDGDATVPSRGSARRRGPSPSSTPVPRCGRRSTGAPRRGRRPGASPMRPRQDDLQPRYEALAAAIEGAYEGGPLTDRLERAAAAVPRWTREASGKRRRAPAGGLRGRLLRRSPAASSRPCATCSPAASRRRRPPGVVDLEPRGGRGAVPHSTRCAPRSFPGSPARDRLGLLAAATDAAYGAGS